MADRRAADPDDDGSGGVVDAARRAGRAWREVGLVALILVLHVVTGGWPGLTIAWVVLLVLRLRVAVRAGRAEQAALHNWSPPSPWRRRRP